LGLKTRRLEPRPASLVVIVVVVAQPVTVTA
jgi:hypothetical protein